MSILVLDQDGRCELERPYLNKFADQNVLVNAVWVGHRDRVEFTKDEKEALDRLACENFGSVIISSGVAYGLNLLDRLRQSASTRHLPVTFL